MTETTTTIAVPDLEFLHKNVQSAVELFSNNLEKALTSKFIDLAEKHPDFEGMMLHLGAEYYDGPEDFASPSVRNGCFRINPMAFKTDSGYMFRRYYEDYDFTRENFSRFPYIQHFWSESGANNLINDQTLAHELHTITRVFLDVKYVPTILVQHFGAPRLVTWTTEDPELKVEIW